MYVLYSVLTVCVIITIALGQQRFDHTVWPNMCPSYCTSLWSWHQSSYPSCYYSVARYVNITTAYSIYRMHNMHTLLSCHGTVHYYCGSSFSGKGIWRCSVLAIATTVPLCKHCFVVEFTQMWLSCVVEPPSDWYCLRMESSSPSSPSSASASASVAPRHNLEKHLFLNKLHKRHILKRRIYSSTHTTI